MPLRYIYFDLDNTLLDHNKAESKSHQAVYDSFPVLRQVPLNEWLETYQEINHNLWVRYQDGEIDRHELHFSRFHDSMVEKGLSTDNSHDIGVHYMEKYHEYWDWVDQAEETIDLVSRHFDVGIITNGFKETQLKKFDKLSMGRFTDQMVISEELGVLKPDPKVFDYATELAGVPREDILYVGDSYSSDVVGGLNAGWKTAWYTGVVGEEEAEQKPHLKFSDFDDLKSYLKIG